MVSKMKVILPNSEPVVLDTDVGSLQNKNIKNPERLNDQDKMNLHTEFTSVQFLAVTFLY